MQHPPDSHSYFRWRKLTWRLRHAGMTRSVHMMRRRVIRPAWYVGWVLWLAGCIMPSSVVATPTPTPVPTATPQPAADGWKLLAPGMERRIYTPEAGFLTRLTAIRMDPAYYTFRVHYRPGEPKYASEWQLELPDAAVIVNGNFFDREDRITGLLIADGVNYGQAYQRRGGTFYIDNGLGFIESNLVRPYAGEAYQQALQAFPMLITDGQISYFDTRPDRATRRTVVGIDRQGRVVILVTSFGGMTLLDMAQFLPTTDLDLWDALNLDGGGSTMLGVDIGGTSATIGSFDPIPAILGVYPKN